MAEHDIEHSLQTGYPVTLFDPYELKSLGVFYHCKIIQHKLDNEALTLTFEDGKWITVSDEGQHCCEERYITCDDNLDAIIGSYLVRVEHKGVGDFDKDPERDYHETAFIEVMTSNGAITLCTHNIHNGYYGGFHLVVRGYK